MYDKGDMYAMLAMSIMCDISPISIINALYYPYIHDR